MLPHRAARRNVGFVKKQFTVYPAYVNWLAHIVLINVRMLVLRYILYRDYTNYLQILC